jgi:hypothetical protein
MNKRPSRRTSALAIAACLLLTGPVESAAQNRGVGGGRGGPGGGFETAREGAPIDLTGTWVSVVTEDWRVRMVTPPKGYYESLPLTAEGLRIADAWDPAQDRASGNGCKAYGGAAIMRAPGRLRISWEDVNTLRIDTDAGMQTRIFHFGQSRAPAGERTLQGHSVAEWEYANTGQGEPPKGNLKVVTTQMQEGYLRKNGVPYSEDALVTEYYDLITAPDGEQWVVVLTEVVDPVYLRAPFITSTQFKHLPDDSGWNPTPCSDR